MDGLGVHHTWGFSPALDLAATVSKHHANENNSGEPLNILVAGSADVRHVLLSLGNRDNFADRQINIYLFDNPIETIARHLVLLEILTDWSVSIRQRANTFLEVFGNSLVQERTSKYLEELGSRLIHFLCNDKGSLKGLVDLSCLSYRQRDQLETIFKTWSCNVPFDAVNLRDQRLRAFYGQRYDHRDGVIDWDYVNQVKPEAGIIHSKQFRMWRKSGIAFEFGDQTYTTPNRTMASYAVGKENGVSKQRRGFWTDIQIGPYQCFGVDCPQPNEFARDLFKIQNKGTGTEQYLNTAVHIAVYNLLAILYQIETGQPYLLTKANDIYSGLKSETALDKAIERLTVTEEATEASLNTEKQQQNSTSACDEDEASDANDGRIEANETVPNSTRNTTLEESKSSVDEPSHESIGTMKSPATMEEVEERLRKIAQRRAKEIIKVKKGVTVTMLSGELPKLLQKSKFQRKFHGIYLSNTASHFLADQSGCITTALLPDAVVLVESPRFLVPLNKQQKAAYKEKVFALAQNSGMKVQESNADVYQFSYHQMQP